MSVSTASHAKSSMPKTSTVVKTGSTVVHANVPNMAASNDIHSVSNANLHSTQSNTSSFPILSSAPGFILSASTVVNVCYGPSNCFKYLVNNDSRVNILLDMIFRQVKSTIGGIQTTKQDKCMKLIQQLTVQSGYMTNIVRQLDDRMNKTDTPSPPPTNEGKESTLSSRLSNNRVGGKFLIRSSKREALSHVVDTPEIPEVIYTFEEQLAMKVDLLSLQKQVEDCIHQLTASKMKFQQDQQSLESVVDVVILDTSGNPVLSRFQEEQGFLNEEKTCVYADPFVATHVSNNAALHKISVIAKPGKFKPKEILKDSGETIEQFQQQRSTLVPGNPYTVGYIVHTDAGRHTGTSLARYEGNLPPFVTGVAKQTVNMGMKEYSLAAFSFVNVTAVLPEAPVVNFEKYKMFKRSEK